MKLLIISDIHGNWVALQAVLRAERHVDHILCLGDLVDYGPQPVECVKWAMKEAGNAWLLQGNHDRAVATGEDPRCSLPYRHLARVTQEFSTRALIDECEHFWARCRLNLHFELEAQTVWRVTRHQAIRSIATYGRTMLADCRSS